MKKVKFSIKKNKNKFKLPSFFFNLPKFIHIYFQINLSEKKKKTSKILKLTITDFILSEN